MWMSLRRLWRTWPCGGDSWLADCSWGIGAGLQLRLLVLAGVLWRGLAAVVSVGYVAGLSRRLWFDVRVFAFVPSA